MFHLYTHTHLYWQISLPLSPLPPDASLSSQYLMIPIAFFYPYNIAPYSFIAYVSCTFISHTPITPLSSPYLMLPIASFYIPTTSSFYILTTSHLTLSQLFLHLPFSSPYNCMYFTSNPFTISHHSTHQYQHSTPRAVQPSPGAHTFPTMGF